ncbi:EVE domain-containing protein [Catenuloplanes sp. NPDC051500]|uniref:EVE domain-containing protein n=1 Tax=Catenuloplanes sp. NPDC051500 TaxID=3363959 RepID=UPI0037A4722D
MTDILRPARAWLGVVQAAHVRRAVTLGIAQLNHGRRTNLARLHRGDGLIYYSARDDLGGRPLRAFTALGIVTDDAPYQDESGPWRRRVDYAATTPALLAEIGTALLVTSTDDWRRGLRFGLIPLPPADFTTLHTAMTT